MLRWLRNKLDRPVYLDCYTADPDAYKVARIKSATHYLPSWWKRLSPTVQMPFTPAALNITCEISTMRHCVGFTDLFKKSFCLPLWSDIVISVNPVGTEGFLWQFADLKSDASEHPAYQRGDFLPHEHFQHLKLNSPWHLKCDEDINFLFFDPLWPSYTGEEQAIIPPGVMNYRYQSGTNINIFIRKLPDRPRQLELKFDTPLVFITPLTERKVILRHHLVTPQEIRSIQRPQTAFVGAYAKSKQALIKTLQETKQEQTND